MKCDNLKTFCFESHSSFLEFQLSKKKFGLWTSIFSFSSQIYGEEIEYAEDIFSSAGPGGGGVTRRSSKKGKLGANHGDSSSTSPERNRKDDLVRENY